MRRLALLALLAAPALPAPAQERSAEANYVLRCAGCHGMEGMGTAAGGVPPFPGSIGHFAGVEPGRTYMLHVPGVGGASLSDAEIAAVMNHILDRWAEGAAPFDAAEVARRRAAEVPDLVSLRREVAADLDRQGLRVADYPWP